MSTSALLLPPFVMLMPSVRILADLIAVLARLDTLVTAKLAKVGEAPVGAAQSPVFDYCRPRNHLDSLGQSRVKLTNEKGQF